jgi:hypothetical protein
VSSGCCIRERSGAIEAVRHDALEQDGHALVRGSARSVSASRMSLTAGWTTAYVRLERVTPTPISLIELRRCVCTPLPCVHQPKNVPHSSRIRPDPPRRHADDEPLSRAPPAPVDAHHDGARGNWGYRIHVVRWRGVHLRQRWCPRVAPAMTMTMSAWEMNSVGRGETASRLHEPSIREMLDPSTRVHVFTRSHDRTHLRMSSSPSVVSAEDTSPATMVRSFEPGASSADIDAHIQPAVVAPFRSEVDRDSAIPHHRRTCMAPASSRAP